MKKTIFLALLVIQIVAMPLWAQQTRKVNGKVTDAKTGESLIGVTIKIQNTQTGTITDIDGNYSLEIPNNNEQTILFSYIGYNEIIEPVGERTVINVQLSELTEQLNEIIIVGYGAQRKESVIGSIASINNKTLVSTPATNLSQSLSGKLSGIQVVQSSGEIGNDVADIYVRGLSTWNDASPLYVVDGIVRAEFAKIDPNEIETINVLKDASATAVYGVKGANGVIIVTTKRGTLGKPKVSVTAQTAITQPINIPQPLGAYDATSLQYLQDWGGYRSRTPRTKDGNLAYDLMLYRTGASPWTHPDVDWVDNVLKDHSSQQQYNVNISGGTKTVKYFVSGGYINQNGFYKNDDLTKYSRFNFRSNIDVEVTPSLSATLSVGSRVENLNSPNSTIWSSWDIYRGAFSNSGRAYPIYNPDGSYAGTGSNLVKRLKEASIYKNNASTLESSLGLNYKLDFITKGLSAKGQVSFDTQGENGRSWSSSTSEYVYDQATNSYQQFGEDRPLSYAGVQKNNNWYKVYTEAALNYSRTFGASTFTGLFLGNRNELIRNDEVAYADQGLVGRVTYDYDKRYFGEFNIGYNGSENFKDGMRYGTFPAFAAGWMLSNENFFATRGSAKSFRA
jgi:TonB-linked SusC/RagA family outer membrane protein